MEIKDVCMRQARSELGPVDVRRRGPVRDDGANDRAMTKLGIPTDQNDHVCAGANQLA